MTKSKPAFRKLYLFVRLAKAQAPSKRVRLTRKNLALFDKSASSAAKTASTTTSGFAVQAYKNGILPPALSKPPTNLGDIRKRHRQRSGTASPTKVYNQPFTGFPKDVGFNNGLSAPQPDFIEGLGMQEYRPFPVDEHVSGAVLYKDNLLSLTLPHLAGEWKGPGKDMVGARLQSGYDGAALVFARNQALALIGKPDPPGHAAVTTFTTDGTSLNLFVHYASPSEDGAALEYHQYPVNSTNLVGSHQGLKTGRRGLRNEQDHAKERSYALRDQLKEHWRQRQDHLQAVVEDPEAAERR
ncbi:hypothetical protein B0T22DRAFT_500801 [Podospora appendiculata]|uniref:Uncharacterized protein n=1 Tax=Podospora appendiculata TaxID=314037 RepID=A0AAE0X6K8_9PEZI|nr:hypothetical protein B0T22DRAFT_500801 [Podospora appendiculata]